MAAKRFSLCALLSGILLAISFTNHGGFLLAFVALAIYLYCLDSSPKAFRTGCAFGFGLLLTGCYWLYYSIHRYGNLPLIPSIAITVLFCLAMSLYYGLQGYCFKRLYRHKSRQQRYLIGFGLTMTIAEYLRASLFTGFPWLLIGYTQTTHALSGIAPFISVFGVSLSVCIISGALVLLIKSHSRLNQLIAAAVITLIFLTATVLSAQPLTHRYGPAKTVALVQGNVAQSIKWDPDHTLAIMRQYWQLTEPYWQHSIIVWPEAAIPVYRRAIPSYMDALNQTAKRNQSTLLLGIPEQKNNKKYNALVALGRDQGQYLKKHLVPFGEYTPLPQPLMHLMKQWQIPLSDLSPGPKKQAPLTAQGLTLAPFICYEIAYPRLVAQSSKNSNAIVVISDDSWFGQSPAAAQQLQMAQMRAIETQRPILYVNNTDHTAIITKYGHIRAITPPRTASVLTGELAGVTGTTPLQSHGLLWLGLLSILLLLLSV